MSFCKSWISGNCCLKLGQGSKFMAGVSVIAN